MHHKPTTYTCALVRLSKRAVSQQLPQLADHGVHVMQVPLLNGLLHHGVAVVVLEEALQKFVKSGLIDCQSLCSLAHQAAAIVVLEEALQGWWERVDRLEVSLRLDSLGCSSCFPKLKQRSLGGDRGTYKG
jgi:hypothetical protein